MDDLVKESEQHEPLAVDGGLGRRSDPHPQVASSRACPVRRRRSVSSPGTEELRETPSRAGCVYIGRGSQAAKRELKAAYEDYMTHHAHDMK